ncbi:MAG: hypothetical protein ACTSUO_04685 [Candidatus Thorarchaeota archaeon]
MSTKAQTKFTKKLDDAENTARIRLFGKAAKKYGGLVKDAQSIEPSMVSGLQFLSALYEVNEDVSKKRDPIVTGTLQKLANLQSLSQNQSLSMGLPGGIFGPFETDDIFTEIKAILRMDEGMATGNQDAFNESIQLFLEIGNSQLHFSRYVRPLQSRVTGSRAALECEARSQIIKGAALADCYPNAAIPHYMIATRALRAARKTDVELKYRRILIGLKMVRCCWICGRLVQGDNHFTNMDSSVTGYFEYILKENKEDLRVYEGNRIVACTPCSSAISKEADRIAKGYYERVKRDIASLKSDIQILKSIIKQGGF